MPKTLKSLEFVQAPYNMMRREKELERGEIKREQEGEVHGERVYRETQV